MVFFIFWSSAFGQWHSTILACSSSINNTNNFKSLEVISLHHEYLLCDISCFHVCRMIFHWKRELWIWLECNFGWSCFRKNVYAVLGCKSINVAFTIFQGRNRQRALEAQLAELTSGQSVAVSGQDFSSPEGSSDADEVCIKKTYKWTWIQVFEKVIYESSIKVSCPWA
jgi:hypothetical protein